VISERLKRVIWKELDLEGFAITEGTVASEVPGWDSLSHVRIISAVETEFGIRFRGLEIMRLQNVGQLQDLVDRKCSGKT
jgi:acyl carrier protein